MNSRPRPLRAHHAAFIRRLAVYSRVFLVFGCTFASEQALAISLCALLGSVRLGTGPDADSIIKPLVQLESLMSTTPPPGRDIADVLVEGSAARIQVMRIQETTDIFKDELSSDLKKSLTKIDRLSKALGEFGDAVQFDKFGRKSLESSLGGRGELTPDQAQAVLLELARRRDKSHAAFLDELKEDEWVGQAQSGPLFKVAKRLGKIDWLGPKKAGKRARRALADHLSTLVSDKYDWEDLEGGTHLLRKRLRGFMISVQSLYGMVVLDRPLTPLPPELAAIADSKYAKMSEVAKTSEQIHLPQESYLEIVAGEKVLGACKDFGQGVDELADVLQKVGLADGVKGANALAFRLARTNPNFSDPMFADIAGTTKRVFTHLSRKGGPLSALTKALDG